MICTGGSAGPGPAQVTEAGSGMEMEEGGAEEDGGWMPGIEFDEHGGGPVGGRTVLKGWDENGGCCGPLECEAAGGWWLVGGGRLWD